MEGYSCVRTFGTSLVGVSVEASVRCPPRKHAFYFADGVVFQPYQKKSSTVSEALVTVRFVEDTV